MDAPINAALVMAGGMACALTLLGLLGSGVSSWRRRAGRRAREQAGRKRFALRVTEAAERARARLHRGLAWKGARSLRVGAIVEECDDIRSFYLESPEGRPFPAFQPGQYLTLHLPGSEGEGQLVRCYSLSDRPRGEYYRLTVRRLPSPADQPDLAPGVGSAYLHDHVAVRDEILCEAPRGAFFLAPQGEGPVVLIGGGIGLTPIVSMASAVAHQNPQREVWLFVGVRNRREHPFKQEIERLARETPGLRVRVAYSRPDAGAERDVDFHREGHVTLDWLQETLPSSNFSFYVCGPPAMMQTLIPEISQWGVPNDALHFEAFGPASVRLPSDDLPEEGLLGASIAFARRNIQAVWSKEDDSLLEVAERTGVPILVGCRAGNCGQCATSLLEGSVAAIKLSGAPVPEGTCLPCISVPIGDVVLDA